MVLITQNQFVSLHNSTVDHHLYVSGDPSCKLWFIRLHMHNDPTVIYYLSTARLKIREFKTLDSVFTWITKHIYGYNYQYMVPVIVEPELPF